MARKTRRIAKARAHAHQDRYAKTVGGNNNCLRDIRNSDQNLHGRQEDCHERKPGREEGEILREIRLVRAVNGKVGEPPERKAVDDVEPVQAQLTEVVPPVEMRAPGLGERERRVAEVGPSIPLHVLRYQMCFFRDRQIHGVLYQAAVRAEKAPH